MAGTRSSARLSANGSPQSATNKRKADDSPSAKTTKKGKTATKQQTLEEAVGAHDESDQPKVDSKMDVDEKQDGDTNGKGDHKEAEQTHQDGENHVEQQNGHSNGDENAQESETAGQESNKATSNGVQDIQGNGELEDESSSAAPADKDQPAKEEVQQSSADTTGGAIEEDKEREEAQPSNVLEKGIIYFFTRGRVGVEQLDSVQDVQRSHFVLRPLPDGAKITDGAMDDTKNNRLIAVPKKVWPKSGQDKFMAFVEKANASNADLKDDFLKGSEYETATLGTRHTPPVTPIGEGVYAITSTGDRGETHLAYMLTLPQEPGQLQEDLGIRHKGAFVVSLKNPEAKGPANASLPEKPDWPKEFIDEFRGRSWMPAHPKHLDYANAQVLLIGEDIESGSALQAADKDARDEAKETPKEEIEKLEHEDEIRVKHLKGDDTIFADLGISKKDYPSVKTTW